MPSMFVFLKQTMENTRTPALAAMAHALAASMSSHVTNDLGRKITEEKFKAFQHEYERNVRATGGSLAGRSEFAMKATYEHMLKAQAQREQAQRARQQTATPQPRRPAPRPTFAR